MSIQDLLDTAVSSAEASVSSARVLKKAHRLIVVRLAVGLGALGALAWLIAAVLR